MRTRAGDAGVVRSSAAMAPGPRRQRCRCAMDSPARVAKVRGARWIPLARVAKGAACADSQPASPNRRLPRWIPCPRQVSVDHSPRSTAPGVTDATRGDV